MPGGLVGDVGVQGDGAVGEVVDGEVAVDDRVDAVFPGQVRLEIVVGLFQGVPVGDDGEIDPDFLHRVPGRGYLAAVVACEIARIGAVSGVSEAGVDEGRSEARQRAGDRDTLEGEGRGRGGRRGCGGRRLGGRFLALVFADAQLPFQVLDIFDEVLVHGRPVVLLFGAEPAAGVVRAGFFRAADGAARTAGQGDHAPELLGAPPHGQEDDRHGDDEPEKLFNHVLHIHSCLVGR